MTTTTAENLKKFRERMGWSIRHISRLVGVSPTAWRRYELGEFRPKHLKATKIINIAKGFGIKLNFGDIYTDG